MPCMIFKCTYLKNQPKSYILNIVNYIATREGVDKVEDTSKHLHATVAQQKMIDSILKDYPQTKEMNEYKDFIKNPTREFATKFISGAIDEHIDLIGKRKNYVEYIANRPKVEKIMEHGLFTDENVPLVLSKVAQEVANHNGNIWTNIISLRREDATRLGYDSASEWIALLRKNRNFIAEQMRIPPEDFHWYAAFHNEGYHPHVHLIAYSTNSKDAYVTEHAIEKMRSKLAQQIFRQDLISVYEEQTKRRDQLKDESHNTIKEIISQINANGYENKEVEEMLLKVAHRLQFTKGKKVYGYLKPELKKLVDGIVDELEKDKRISELYNLWYEKRNEVLNTYTDNFPEKIPLSMQKEFKSIKNVIITEAVNLSNDLDAVSDELLIKKCENSDNYEEPVIRLKDSNSHDNKNIKTLKSGQVRISLFRILNQMSKIISNDIRDNDDRENHYINKNAYNETKEKLAEHGIKLE